MGRESAAIIAAIFILGVFAGYEYSRVTGNTGTPSGTGQVIQSAAQENSFVPASIESSVTIEAPAIDAGGRGVAIPITVQKRGGYGETLINIDNLVFWFDTQESIQTARAVAEIHTGADMKHINLVYTANTSAGILEGPSAGAALTIATIAAIENRTLNRSVMITGTINPDGSIGPVGGIAEKAKAAKELGAKLFLVPKGQGRQTTLKPVESCSDAYVFTYCRTRYAETVTDISEAAKIPVKEVSTIDDAGKYLLEPAQS